MPKWASKYRLHYCVCILPHNTYHHLA